MNEQIDELILTTRLRTALCDEPPLGFDPDDVVTRAAQRQRRRRAITLTGTGVAVLAVAAVAVPLALGTPSATGAAHGAGPAVTTAPAPTVWPPATSPVAALPHQQLADRQTQGAHYLAGRAPELIPGAVVRVPARDDGFAGTFENPQTRVRRQGFSATVEVSAAGRSMELALSVMLPLGHAPQRSLPQLCADQRAAAGKGDVTCTTSVLPSGDILVVTHAVLDFKPGSRFADGRHQEYAAVTDLRSDGTVVSAESDLDPGAGADHVLAGTAALRELATDPALRLTGPAIG